ncbi:AaceriAGL302Cp [[Ashbya] aceris (nom. inval.)]|nr:AaceriAGL302Cp [[Ashbya] aceris (nom. inval.)]
MPGQIVSIPFISQIEDMDKYLVEYRALKSMPAGAGFGQSGAFRQGNRGPVAARKRTGGYDKRFQVGTGKYGGQPVAAGLQQGYPAATYPQVFYGGKLGSGGSSGSLPLMTPQASAQASAQAFLASSSSSGSTSPPRLQSTISGSSTINSLGSDFGEYPSMVNELNKQYDSIGFGQGSSGSPGVSNFNIGSPFTQSSTPLVSTAATNGEFMHALPSSLLGDTSVNSNISLLAGTRSLSTSVFLSNQYPSSSSQSSFTMLPGSNSTWGTSPTVTTGTTGANQSNSSSTSGSLRIWNNDMSVWG